MFGYILLYYIKKKIKNFKKTLNNCQLKYQKKTVFHDNNLKLLSAPILPSKKNLVSLKDSLNDIEILSPKKKFI